MKYDFLIIGAGFAGATCARLLTDKGYTCLIVEERPFVGGNSVTNNVDGIDIHIIGPHVFHTNNINVWDFVNKYTEFINCKHTVLTYSFIS
jgi:UDP-galactopyranose mutase